MYVVSNRGASSARSTAPLEVKRITFLALGGWRSHSLVLAESVLLGESVLAALLVAILKAAQVGAFLHTEALRFDSATGELTIWFQDCDCVSMEACADYALELHDELKYLAVVQHRG